MSSEGTRRAGAPRELGELWRDEAAPTAVEYGIMVGLIAGAIVAAVGTFGQIVLKQLFQRAADAMP